MGKTLFLWCRCAFSFGFSFFFPFFSPKEQVFLCLSCGRWRITQTLGPCAQEIVPSLRTLTNEAEQTLDLPRRRSRQGTSPWLSTWELLGPFEQEEEGTGVVSDVVEVEGEDPNTPGYLRGDRVRLGRQRSRIVGASPLVHSRWSPRPVHNDSPILVNKTK